MSKLVKLTLPRLMRIERKENGNTVQQLQLPAWEGEGVVEQGSTGQTQGVVVRCGDESDPVYITGGSGRQGGDFERVLKLPMGTTTIDAAISTDFSRCKWLKHPDRQPQITDIAEFIREVASTRDSWRGAFVAKREDVALGVDGLRPPQIGAIFAVQSHWTINTDVATVVLPTGVGKTETMLALLIAEHCERLLVVVPTDALRTQIGEKFVSLGLLKSPRFQIVAATARYPIVGILNQRPKNPAEVDSLFLKCNVIITTMALANQCPAEVTARMAELCPYLFIDEAHHVAAPKWTEFKEIFARSRIVQFTATPFRNDDRPIGGQRLFTFSLRHAQEQGYFKPIRFQPVIEFNPDKHDSAIAEAAVQQLRNDAHLGHILMARVATIDRARQVFECYGKYTDFHPVQIHTGVKSKAEREIVRGKLLSGESRIVVCVDMLGEGFDLPELKIAAFHDIRKSLSVTLQLAGRFTRTKPHLGNATFIANVADLEVKDELRRLYQHDSDWNALLPVMSEEASVAELELADFLKGFQELPDEMTLRNVRPAMSTVVYRTKCGTWTPENFAEGISGYKSLDRVYHSLNPQGNTLVVVTTRRVPVEWVQSDDIYNWDWQLYVLYWDQPRGLLFIHNSANGGFFKKLAKAVAGEVEQLQGPSIFRSLARIHRLKLQNVGLLEQVGRLIRFTMRAGSDVESGMTTAQRQRAIKSNLFGQGYEHGERTTIGCSYKGRIWSHRTSNLLELTRWCDEVGAMLAAV